MVKLSYLRRVHRQKTELFSVLMLHIRKTKKWTKGMTQREKADINVGGNSRKISIFKHGNQVKRVIQQRESDQLCRCFQEINTRTDNSSRS